MLGVSSRVAVSSAMVEDRFRFRREERGSSSRVFEGGLDGRSTCISRELIALVRERLVSVVGGAVLSLRIRYGSLLACWDMVEGGLSTGIFETGGAKRLDGPATSAGKRE